MLSQSRDLVQRYDVKNRRKSSHKIEQARMRRKLVQNQSFSCHKCCSFQELSEFGTKTFFPSLCAWLSMRPLQCLKTRTDQLMLSCPHLTFRFWHTGLRQPSILETMISNASFLLFKRHLDSLHCWESSQMKSQII